MEDINKYIKEKLGFDETYNYINDQLLLGMPVYERIDSVGHVKDFSFWMSQYNPQTGEDLREKGLWFIMCRTHYRFQNGFSTCIIIDEIFKDDLYIKSELKELKKQAELASKKLIEEFKENNS